MRYQKPIVMDLSGQARASGLTPLGCYNGTAAGITEFCQTGGSPLPALFNCGSGPVPAVGPGFACISGAMPETSFCMIGTGATAIDACTSGPQPVT